MTTTAAPSGTRRAAGAAEGAGPEQRHRTVLVWVVPSVLSAVTVAVHVVLARHMRTPIIHADEFGYLMGARFMARGGSPTGSPYYPGYSALLVPLWWISRHPMTVYRWALDVNAVLAGATAVLSFLLARRLAPRSGPLTWGAAALVVSAYPAVVMYSNLAESENLLVPGFLTVCLLVLRAVDVPTARRWGTAGGAAGLLYAVHGRALAVAAAFAVTAVVSLHPWRQRRNELLTAGGALLAGLGAAAVWVDWVTFGEAGRQLPTSDTRSPSLLSRVTTTGGLRHLGVILAGQGLYLMVSAGALMALGLVWGWSRFRRPAASRSEREGALFVLLVLLLVAMLSAVFLATGTRVDNPVYGRYVEVFSVPLLLIGALTGMTQGRLSPSPSGWRTAAAAGVATTALWAVVLAYWGSTVRGTVVRTNALGMAELFRGPDTASRLVLPVALAVAIGGIVVVLGAHRIAPVVGVMAAIGVMIPASLRAYGDVVDQSSAAVLEQVVPTTLAATKRHFGPMPCVSWDSSVNDAWQFYNTRLLVPDVVFPVFDSTRGGRPSCTTGVVVSGRAFGTRPAHAGARLVVLGNDPAAVWVLPGTMQTALDRAGWLLPAGFPAPLPDAAASGSLRLAGAASPSSGRLTLSRHGSRALSVSVSHSGGGSPWPNATSVGPVPQDAVRLAVAWFQGPANARRQVAAGRADLAVSLLPGQSERATVTIAPQAFGSTVTVPRYLAPGVYDVEISLIQESVRPWDATVTPIRLRVTVTP